MKTKITILVSVLLTVIFFCCTKKDTILTPNGNMGTYQMLDSLDSLEGISLDKKLTLLNTLLFSRDTIKQDSLYLYILWKKSNLIYAMGALDSVLYYDKLFFSSSKRNGSLFFLSKAASNLGFDYSERQVYDSAFFYYQEAKKVYEELNDSSKVVSRLLDMGRIQNRTNDFFGSKETLTEALSFFSSEKDNNIIASILNELGNNNSELGNFEGAEYYYKKASELTTNGLSKSVYNNNLATNYINTKNYNQAIKILEEEFSSKELGEDRSEYARMLHNLAYAKWQNKSQLSDSLFLEALEIRKTTNDQRGQISSYTDISEYYLGFNFKKAKKYLDTAILLAKHLKIPKAETDALQLLMQLDSLNIGYKDRYIFLKDSLYRQELKVKTQFAKMRYDDQQEKAQILRLEAETAQKNNQLAQKETQNILYLSFACLLLMGGSGLYFLLVQRHKKEKLQEVYKKEKQIGKRLHDELSNDIFGLMTQLQQKPAQVDTPLLDDLQKIYQHTRDISHDHREIETGKGFMDELQTLFSTFNSDETRVVVKGPETIAWEKLPEYKCVAVYRSLNELLVNMKKHSKASLAVIRFEHHKKRLIITYTDNGIGLAPNQKLGMGLKNTVSRIAGVNGTLTFGKEQHKGTKITIALPF